MNEIIPALIPKNLNIIRDSFSQILGLVKKVQIDIVDGEYAPVKTWPFNKDQGDEMLNFIRGEALFPYVNELNLEIDMLVLHPIEYLSDWLSIGAKSFVIHFDSTDHLEECIKTIRDAKRSVAIGVKPSVPISQIEPFLPQIDFIQFMGNEKLGYNGVSLEENVLEKIKNFHDIHPSIPIQIDIGVNTETVSKLKEVGVSQFISNSAIFGDPNPKQALLNLQRI